MIRTVEAVIDEQGNVRLLEPVQLPAARRALVTILEEQPVAGIAETALLSEPALAEDWNRPEEDEAWSVANQAAPRRRACGRWPWRLGPLPGDEQGLR
jgi:hypothetical protein